MQTHVYKVVGDCAIKGDVHGGGAGGGLRPVALWIHGGALILGHRRQVDVALLAELLALGFVFVSIDYRLAPETKLPEIIEDVRDAHAWLREKGPALFGADPDRIGVLGGSAGGYLTLMTGFCVRPRPKALVSVSGYGDIAGQWYSRPDPFYCAKPAVSAEAAYAAVGDKAISEEPSATQRGQFYLYCRQQGVWPEEVLGRDPDAEPEAFHPYCPVRNVTRAYPPTLLIHGDKDTDVPYEQSAQMAAALAQAGLAHEFMTVEGSGHGLDGATPQVLALAREKTVAFLLRHVKAAGD